MRGVLLAAVVGVALVGPAAAVEARTVFSFQDARIRESSGLVDLGSLMVTVNDSGDSARVFVVDPASGETVGVTDFDAEVKDVESLAPAGPNEVWVGDTGGNITSRSAVEVYRVPVGRGNRTVTAEHYTLSYPKGKYDAESLFADRHRRLFLITKSGTGGIVFRAPVRLRRDGRNELEPIARIPIYATDAALLADGDHVLVRSLATAAVYRLPDFAAIGSFDLPRQRQGEGVSVGPGNRIRLSSEGVHAAVLEVELPASVVRAMQGPVPTATPTPETGLLPGRYPDEGPNVLAWVAGGVLLAAAVGVGLSVRRGR